MLLGIMLRLVKNRRFIELFLYFHGSTVFVRKIQMTHEKKLRRKLIVFVFNAIQSKPICMAFLDAKLHLM